MPIANETLLWLLCSEKWRIFTWYLRARRLCPRTIFEFQNCDEGQSVWEREQRTFDWSKYFSCDVLYFYPFQITLWMMVSISRPSDWALASIGSITWSMAQKTNLLSFTLKWSKMQDIWFELKYSLVVGSHNVWHCVSLVLIYPAGEGADCAEEAGLVAMKKLVSCLMLAFQLDILSKVWHKGGQVEKTALLAQ